MLIPGWLSFAYVVTTGIGRAFFTGGGGHRGGWR